MLCRIERERGDVVWVGTITDEASSCVTVQADHEEECEMVRVPEGLKALCTDLVMGSGVHEDHNKEHEVPGDTASLGVVDVKCNLRSNLWLNKVRDIILPYVPGYARVLSTLKKLT